LNSTPHRGKILGILILVVVALGSVGAYLVSNRPLGTTTLGQTSTTALSSSSTSTQIATTSTTSVTWPPIQWITVGKVRPVNYYLTLLESNGTQPYLRLGEELRRLPDLTNATAVATITYLALNATDPFQKGPS
jgi:hypothetical protein